MGSVIFSNILCQAMYGVGTIMLTFAGAHFASKSEFARISSAFLLVNLSLGAIMAWETAKWRDRIRDDDGLVVAELPGSGGLFFVVILFSLVSGAAIVLYDAVLFSGSCAPIYVVLACVSSGVYVAHRRLALLSDRVTRVAIGDFARMACILLCVFYWSNFGANFEKFWVGLFWISTVPLAITMIWNGQKGVSQWRVGITLSSFRMQSFYRALTLTPNSSSMLKAGLFALVASQIATISLPALIPAQYVATVRAYELLFFPLFFAIQAIDPIVSRKMVSLEMGNRRRLQFRMAMLVSIGLSVAFLLSVLFVYLMDFGEMPWGIVIPHKYRDSVSVLNYVSIIGVFICLSVGLRWIGVGRHTGLNMPTATLVALVLSIAVTYGVSCIPLPLEAAFIGKLVYECVLLLLLTREVISGDKNV